MNSQRILIVEDHKDSIQWIAAVMLQYGYTPLEACDGTSAIRKAFVEHPDLILLDIHLPAGSGYFVLETLKKNEETKSIPVIIMTGDVELELEEMKRLGAAAMFKKPMDVHAFLRTIKTALEPANIDRTLAAV